MGIGIVGILPRSINKTPSVVNSIVEAMLTEGANSNNSTNLQQMVNKSYQQLKYEAGEREMVTQFPVKFADGTVIHIQPDTIDNTGCFKKPNNLEYLKKHHPERVSEYQTYLDNFNASLRHIDSQVYGRQRESYGGSDPIPM